MLPRLSRLRVLFVVPATLLLLSGCGSDAVDTATPPGSGGSPSASAARCATTPTGSDRFVNPVHLTTTADGLQYGDIVTGTGPAPQKGDNVTVQYTGWLTNGCVFDSSREPGRTPFQFVIGATPPNVIAGWEEGVLPMHVGGKRRLVIPPSLGYGAAAQGPIPPNSTLVFEVQLLAVGPPPPSPT